MLGKFCFLILYKLIWFVLVIFISGILYFFVILVIFIKLLVVVMFLYICGIIENVLLCWMLLFIFLLMKWDDLLFLYFFGIVICK